MALAEAFVDIVGDPRRFDQAWARLQRRVSNLRVPIAFDASVAAVVSRVTRELEAVPPIDIPVTADTTAMVAEVVAAEAALPDAVVPVEADTTPLVRQATAAGASAGRASGSAFLTNFSIAIAGIAAGVGIAGAAIGAFGLKAAADLEQTAIAFESLAGSAEEGQRILQSLQRFAATTPFEFPEITTSARRLLAMGDAAGIARDQLEAVLTTIGDVASVTGGGAVALDRVTLALGQIASRGRVSLEEINQISEALPGFSGVAAIAAARGITTGEAMDQISAGAITAQDGIAALLAGMQQFPGAANAMAKQSQTLLGVFSTFKDVVSQTLAGAFTPVIPAVKDALTGLTPVLGEALGQLGPLIGQSLAQLLPFIGQLVQALTPILGPLLAGLSAGLAAIGPALVPLGQALGAIAVAVQPLLGFIGELAAAVGQTLAPIIAGLVPLFTSLVTVVQSALRPMIPLIVQIGQAIGDFLLPFADLLADLFDQLAPIIEDLATQLAASLIPLFAELGPLAVQMAEALIPLVPAIIELLPPLVEITAAMAPLIVLLAELLKLAVAIAAPILKLAAELIKLLAVEAIAPLFQLLADAITSGVKPLSDFFKNISKLTDAINGVNWGQLGDQIVNGFLAALRAVGDFFSRLPGRIGDALAALPRLIGQAFSRAFDFALQSIGRGIGLVLAAITRLPRLALDALAAMPRLIGDFFAFLWDQAITRTTNALSSIVDFVRGLPSRIGAALAQLPVILANAFRDAFAGARAIALSILDSIVGAVRGIPARVAAFAGQLFNAGKALIDGFARGIRNVGNFIGDVAGDVVNAIKGFLNRVISKINDGIADIDAILPGGLPRLPLLARGGLALGPSIIGERKGKPELAVPLGDPLAQEAIRQALGGAVGGQTITFGPGAIVVNAAPGMTPAQATEIGRGLGAGLTATLTRRDIRTAVRMI